MHIDVITGPKELTSLRTNWENLYEQDPDAHYFLSWAFISTYIRRFDGEWFVLAARSGPKTAPYVAFLPLRMRTRMKPETGDFYNEITMGGNYAADYTGIICSPDLAKQAIAAFAKHLKTLHWAFLHLENLRMSEPRLRWLLDNLQDKRLEMKRQERVNKRDNVDNCICPEIHLPGSWEEYLERKLSTNTRQKMRRFLRKLESSDEFRITHADASTIERDLDILLAFWSTKWASRKGKLMPGLVKSNRDLFRRAFHDDTLLLPVLWHGEQPLSALAIFVDRVKKQLLFHMVGRDETANIVPSGLILHGHCIRWAIENGFQTYDFLRGNEPYKYSFGAQERFLNCVLVRTHSGRNLDGKLDFRALGGAIREAGRFRRKGHLVQAENVLRQVLATDPYHAQALLDLGHLMAAQGNHRVAANCFGRLTSIASGYLPGFLSLAVAHQSLMEHEAAETAFRRALSIDPEAALAQYGLGRSLLALGKRVEAAEAFEAVLRNPSQLPGDTALKAKAAKQLRTTRQIGVMARRMDEPRRSVGPDFVPRPETAVAMYLPLPSVPSTAGR